MESNPRQAALQPRWVNLGSGESGHSDSSNLTISGAENFNGFNLKANITPDLADEANRRLTVELIPLEVLLDDDFTLTTHANAMLPLRFLSSITNDNFKYSADGFLYAWKVCCYALTEAKFNKKWAKLCKTFKDQPHLLNYLEKTYIPFC